MKAEQICGNTWVLDGPQLIGLYRINETECLLFDPGSSKMREPIEEILSDMGLTPVGVLCTHMHYDHHENTRYFRDKYGAKTCLPRIEADIVRCDRSLKNHLFNFTAGMIRELPRMKNLVCPVDYIIELDQEEFEFCGVTLKVVHTPGHSPDHVCFITPDDVCFAGDVMMTSEILKEAMVPFVFDMTDDLDSKEKMKDLKCQAYIFAHRGILYGNVLKLAQENIDHIRRQLEVCGKLADRPMTYSEFYEVVVQTMNLPVGHPIRAQHLERYIRPYLEYLIDVGTLKLIDINGAPAVEPI